MLEMTLYRYNWANNEKRATFKGRVCRVLARGKMNTVMIEFLDNKERVTTSRYALRRIEP
jgi:hypothetical protein